MYVSGNVQEDGSPDVYVGVCSHRSSSFSENLTFVDFVTCVVSPSTPPTSPSLPEFLPLVTPESFSDRAGLKVGRLYLSRGYHPYRLRFVLLEYRRGTWVSGRRKFESDIRMSLSLIYVPPMKYW